MYDIADITKYSHEDELYHVDQQIKEEYNIQKENNIPTIIKTNRNRK